MSFIKFFWRDFKSDQAYNWFTILCASLGIIGLLLVESFRIGIEDKVSKNAKNFIASDLSISSRQALSPSENAAVVHYLNDHHYSYTLWTDTYSLVTRGNSKDPISKLADLNFVGLEFPYYGSVELEGLGKKGPGDFGSLHQSPTAWLSRDLAWELEVKRGDFIKVGETQFMVDGIITEDKFSSFRGFNLAPKVFLSQNFLAKTELIKFGSTASFTYAIKLPENAQIKIIQKELRTLLPDKSVKIVGPEESSEQIGRALRILGDYLSLITLMTYLLSLVGLYYFTQHFLSKKIKTFSIYKALGIKSSYLFKVNFTHLIVLTTLAVLISTSIIFFSLPLLETYFSQLVGESLIFRLNGLSLLRILTLTILGSIMALGPLFWGALDTPVAVIFQDLPAELKRIKFYYFIPLFLYIVTLTMLLANSFKVGGYFLGALIAIILLAAGCFKLVTLLLLKMAPKLQFINRHAAITLGRYFTSSFTIFICLLLGLTLTTFIFQLERSLRSEFTQTYGQKKPDIFMFDLQDNQAEKFDQLVASEKWNRTLSAPMIRGRLLKINNEASQKKEEVAEVNLANRDEEESKRMRNRGVNLSYRSKLSWSEKLVDGVFNGETCDPTKKDCDISLEKKYAARMGVKLGDKLVFDISGVEVTGIVRSFRQVKWTSFEPNFFILFQPGVLEDAPKTYLSSFKVKSLDEQREIFKKVALNFPNVSILEVSEVIKKITTIFDLMAIAIKFIAFLSLFVALVVLVAVSFNHLDLRKREMTLYYMLGLRTQKIKQIYNREFSFLVIFCIVLALLFGSGLSLIMMKTIFDSEAILRLSYVTPIMVILGVSLSVIVAFRIRYLVKNKSLF